MRKRKVFIENLHKTTTLFIRLTLLVSLAAAVYNGSWIVGFLSLATFLLTFLPYFFEKQSNIDIPTELELISTLFIYTTLFLGEAENYYLRFPWWDLLIHGFSALGLGFIGFLVLYTVHAKGKFKAKPLVVAVFSFCFSLAVSALWEIFEFTMDTFFGTNMLKSGLVDTMGDLILGTIGAFIASFLGFLYLKYHRIHFLRQIVEKFKRDNPELFR